MSTWLRIPVAPPSCPVPQRRVLWVALALALALHGVAWHAMHARQPPPRPMAESALRQRGPAAVRIVPPPADAPGRRGVTPPATQPVAGPRLEPPRAAARPRGLKALPARRAPQVDVAAPAGRPAGPDSAGAPVAAAPAGPAGASSAAEMPPAATVAPAARIPPPVALSYRLRRGAVAASAVLSWQVDAAAYRLSLIASDEPAGTAAQAWHSTGVLGATGLEPRRHTDKGSRRSERAVTFEPGEAAAPGLIRYSGSTATRALAPLAQDRLSWIAQVVAVANAWPQGRPPAGAVVQLPVAAAAGDLQAWQLRVVEAASPGGAEWIGLRHEPGTPYETRVEVWLDPAAGFWPARLRLQEARGPALELDLESAAPPPAAALPASAP